MVVCRGMDEENRGRHPRGFRRALVPESCYLKETSPSNPFQLALVLVNRLGCGGAGICFVGGWKWSRHGHQWMGRHGRALWRDWSWSGSVLDVLDGGGVLSSKWSEPVPLRDDGFHERHLLVER